MINRDTLFTLASIADGAAAAAIKFDPRTHYQILIDLVQGGLPADPTTPQELRAALDLVNNIHAVVHFAQADLQRRAPWAS